MEDVLEEIEDDEDLYNERDPNMPPLGSRVRRGRDWQWGNQDRFGPGGWLKVEWDMDSTTIYHYRYGSNHTENDKYDVKVCNEPRLLENQLIETGCLVTRGPDWNCHDQDGGVGTVGSVLSVKDNGVLVCIK
uniref:MIB/HERC2 domain-containing protein n=1 Tax=Magallana gigas TaxID=29159 RepID=A0A8W8I4E4_MAGGI